MPRHSWPFILSHPECDLSFSNLYDEIKRQTPVSYSWKSLQHQTGVGISKQKCFR